MFLFLITFYLNNNLVNCGMIGLDTALPPPRRSESVFIEDVGAHENSGMVPRSQPFFRPGHRLKPMHSFYVGLRPYVYPKSQSKENIYLANRALPEKAHFHAAGSARGGKGDRTHLFWPPELMPIPLKAATKEGVFFPTIVYPYTQLTRTQPHTSSSPENLDDDLMSSTILGMTASDPTDPEMTENDPMSTGKPTSKHLVYLAYSTPVTEKTAELFHVDDKGFHYVSILTKPETTTVFSPGRPVKTLWLPTTEDTESREAELKEIHAKNPKQRFLDKMDELHEGYLMIFLLEFAKQVSIKEEEYLKEILVHTEAIYNRMRDSGRFEWVVDPLQAAAWKVTVILSDVKKMQNLRTYSSMMAQMLAQRKKVLSSEVNIIIDEADLFYNDEEGERLFSALLEFEQYPTNTSKTGYYLCDSFIQSLMTPFRRLSGSIRRKRLLERVNRALKSRFPELSKRKHNYTNHEGNKGSSTKKKQYEPADERHEKRLIRFHKELQKLGYNNESIYVRHFSIGYKNSMLRTMLDQARYRDAGSDFPKPALRTTAPSISSSVTHPALRGLERDEEPGFEQGPPEKDTLNMKFEGVFRSVSSAAE